MTDKETEKEVKEILANYRALIGATPTLISLLYDADMLPEQIISIRGAISVAAVCEAYMAGVKDGIARGAA